MERLEKFYKYGLSQAGWNRYSYINLEFDNQIICKRKDGKREEKEGVDEALAVSDVIGATEQKPESGQKTEQSAVSAPTKKKAEAKQPEPKKSETTTDKKNGKTENTKPKSADKTENSAPKTKEKKKQKLNR